MSIATQITGTSSSIGAITLSLGGYLPDTFAFFASMAGLIWFTICIKESRTYLNWSHSRRARRDARRLLALKAAEKIAIAEIEAAEKLRQARVVARELIVQAMAEAAKLVAKNSIVERSDEIVEAAKDTTKADAIAAALALPTLMVPSKEGELYL